MSMAMVGTAFYLCKAPELITYPPKYNKHKSMRRVRRIHRRLVEAGFVKVNGVSSEYRSLVSGGDELVTIYNFNGNVIHPVSLTQHILYTLFQGKASYFTRVDLDRQRCRAFKRRFQFSHSKAAAF